MKKIKYVGWLIAFLLCITVIAALQTRIRTEIKKYLLSNLIRVDKLPPNENFDAIYILGGDQWSLYAKYKTAASFYAQERCKEFVILNRPGITEYNRALERNLTNNEWSLMTLKRFDIPSKDIQILKIKHGLFGTYSEARGVSKLAKERGWKRLLLITSPHHTKRTRESFDYFSHGTIVKIFVGASDEKAGLLELMREFIKLKFYELFLLT